MPADSEPADGAVAQVTDPTDPPLPTWDDAVQQAGGMPTPIVPDGVQFAEPVPGYPQSTQPEAQQQQPSPADEPTFSAPPPPLPDHLPPPDPPGPEAVDPTISPLPFQPPTEPLPMRPIEELRLEDPQEQSSMHVGLPDEDVIEAAEGVAIEAEVAEADVAPEADAGGFFKSAGEAFRAVDILSGEHSLGQALQNLDGSFQAIAESVATAVENHDGQDVHEAEAADVHEAAAAHDADDDHDDGPDE